MIYLLEDDDSIRKLVVYALRSQGYLAEGFERPGAFREAAEREAPELVLLDIMLPEEDGLSVLRWLRARRETQAVPVLMLTAKGSEYDRVEGLDAGADDYIVKPFGMMELMARVRAALRRAEARPRQSEYRLGALRVRPEKREVLVRERPVSLTNKEYQLLILLLEGEGAVLERARLMDEVWGLGAEPENRTLDVHIRTLRAKLGEAGQYIETVRGVGYRLREART
ncbi:MAG: response regulator transcription factor [bacterium]